MNDVIVVFHDLMNYHEPDNHLVDNVAHYIGVKIVSKSLYNSVKH